MYTLWFCSLSLVFPPRLMNKASVVFLPPRLAGRPTGSYWRLEVQPEEAVAVFCHLLALSLHQLRAGFAWLPGNGYQGRKYGAESVSTFSKKKEVRS